MLQEMDSAVLTRRQGLIRALLGWATLCAGIGLSISIARAVGGWVSAGPAFVAVLQAVLVSALVVPALVMLRRRVDRRSLEGLGLSRRWGHGAWIGAAVGLGTAVVVWLPAFLIGWVRLDHVDAVTLLTFLAVNAVVLLLYEALPEELALRGYGWSNLRDGWSPVVATVTITLLFCFSSALISVAHAGSAWVLGVESTGVSLTPVGSDPVEYLVQIIFFGLALIAARRLPIQGALAVAISFHVVQLTVNRVLLGGLDWLDSGAEVEFVASDAILLVLVHITLSGLLFVLLRRRWQRRSGDAVSAGASSGGPTAMDLPKS